MQPIQRPKFPRHLQQNANIPYTAYSPAGLQVSYKVIFYADNSRIRLLVGALSENRPYRQSEKRGKERSSSNHPYKRSISNSVTSFKSLTIILVAPFLACWNQKFDLLAVSLCAD